MSFLSWIVLGAIAGSVANLIDPRASRGGLLGSIILGILGAVVGGWLGSNLFGVSVSGFNLESFLVAVGGSLLLLLAGRMLARS